VNKDWQHIDGEACRRFQSSVELVGKRWSSGILLAVAQGATRFSEIIASVPGLSDRLLAQRVKELEASGMLERQVIASTPVQVRYHLTAQGRDLMDSLQPLMTWGQRWATRQPTSVSEEVLADSIPSSSASILSAKSAIREGSM
jgi:DNA-binding HxlR family transcriptional regulator